MEVFQRYLKIFQSDEPQMHKLFPEMVLVIRSLSSWIMRPEFLASCSIDNLLNTEQLSDEECISSLEMFLLDQQQPIM